MVVNGRTTRGYDLKTGAELWNCSGQTTIPIPSVVSEGGLLIAMSGFRGSAIRAIKLGSTGILDETEGVLWTHSKSTPYVVSGNNGRLS